MNEWADWVHGGRGLGLIQSGLSDKKKDSKMRRTSVRSHSDYVTATTRTWVSSLLARWLSHGPEGTSVSVGACIIRSQIRAQKAGKRKSKMGQCAFGMGPCKLEPAGRHREGLETVK
jgi:hypothetical protein